MTHAPCVAWPLDDQCCFFLFCRAPTLCATSLAGAASVVEGELRMADAAHGTRLGCPEGGIYSALSTANSARTKTTWISQIRRASTELMRMAVLLRAEGSNRTARH